MTDRRPSQSISASLPLPSSQLQTYFHTSRPAFTLIYPISISLFCWEKPSDEGEEREKGEEEEDEKCSIYTAKSYSSLPTSPLSSFSLLPSPVSTTSYSVLKRSDSFFFSSIISVVFVWCKARQQAFVGTASYSAFGSPKQVRSQYIHLYACFPFLSHGGEFLPFPFLEFASSLR